MEVTAFLFPGRNGGILSALSAFGPPGSCFATYFVIFRALGEASGCEEVGLADVWA